MKITGRYARDVRRAKMISFMMSFLLCGGIGGLYIQPVFKKTDPIENSGRNVEMGGPIRDSGEELRGNPPQDDSGDTSPRTSLKYDSKDSAKKKTYDEQVKIAVVIGIDDYGNNPDYGDLRGAEKDATDMAKFFAEQGYQKIYLLRSTLREKEFSSPENGVYSKIQKPTRKNILDQIEAISEDYDHVHRLAFYFAGHGETPDKTPRLLSLDEGVFEFSDVLKQISILNKQLKGKSGITIQDVLLIIDACNIGKPQLEHQIQIQGNDIPKWLWAVASTRKGDANDSPKGGVFTQILLEKYKSYDGMSYKTNEGTVGKTEPDTWVDAKEIEQLKQEEHFVKKQSIVVEIHNENVKLEDFIIFKVTEDANE